MKEPLRDNRREAEPPQKIAGRSLGRIEDSAAPLTAAALGTVALVGIGLNFAAIPIAAVAVPGVFASLLALPVWPGLAASLAAGSGLALHGLESLALAGAAVPGGHVVTEASPGAAIPWIAASWSSSGACGGGPP